jgi:hypothetical protein
MGITSHRGHYLDLDPTYRDAYGLPLLCLTFDWDSNERKASDYIAGVFERMVKTMGPASTTSAASASTTASSTTSPPTIPGGPSWALTPRPAR